MKKFIFLLLLVLLLIVFYKTRNSNIVQNKQSTSTTDSSGVSFVDIRESSGINFKNVIVAPGKQGHYVHGSGMAVGDIDNDGLYDIYFVNQKGANALYKNLGNGKFLDVSKSSNTGISDRISVAASFADIDNDGDQDLFVTAIRKGTILFENDGKGVFKDISESSGLSYKGHPATALFFDYNLDGNLDVLITDVGVFTNAEELKAKALGYYQPMGMSYVYTGFSEDKNVWLYKNNGNKKFQNVTKEAGFDVHASVGAATILDIDNNGFVDVYITNMEGPNLLFTNKNGVFTNETAKYFPKTPFGAMGAKWFDYDNNGLFDLYVTDMHSDMIDWDSRKNPSKVKFGYNAFAMIEKFFGYDPNKMIYNSAFYKNTRSGYEDVANNLHAETFWPWGIATGDIDMDGDEDIFLASGMGHPYTYQENVLLRNDQNMFNQAQNAWGIEPRKTGNTIKNYGFIEQNNRYVDGVRSSRSGIVFDFDNDGDLDIVTNEYNDYPLVLENRFSNPTSSSYIKVVLEGSKSNKNAIGSFVTLETTDGKKQYRMVDGNSGYFSFSVLPAYFGVPKGVEVKELTVRFPSGSVKTLKPALNSTITVVE